MAYTDYSTDSLYDLVPLVRSALSDVSSEYMSDDQILNDLVKAREFCHAVSGSTSETVYMGQCIVAVATYYSYVNYTTLAERNMGTLPPTAQVRISTLRRIAAALLQLIAIYPLTDDLTIDSDQMDIPVSAITKMYSVLDDDV
jgi:hypothetical protein